MTRFEKVSGYNAVKDNEEVEFTFEYEPKTYSIGEFDVEDMLNLLNGMNDEILALRNQIAYLQSMFEADE